MGGLVLLDGVTEYKEHIDDPKLVGDRDLAAASRMPVGTPCPCGNPLPWRAILSTAQDPTYEHEIACQGCRREYTIKAGMCWDGAA